MKELTKQMQKRIYNIEKAKIELGRCIEDSIITENDIFGLLKKDINYGVRKLHSSNEPREIMLKNIFNCPFLLCDQPRLSMDVKQLLPYLLNTRYNIELESLKIYLEQGLIDEREYNEAKKELKFFYYEYSMDGRSILETGHAFFGNEKLKAR